MLAIEIGRTVIEAPEIGLIGRQHIGNVASDGRYAGACSENFPKAEKQKFCCKFNFCMLYSRRFPSIYQW